MLEVFIPARLKVLLGAVRTTIRSAYSGAIHDRYEGHTTADRVAVDLIADDPFVVLFTDLNRLFKLVLRPDTACRVMRAAHHENLVCRVRHLLIEILKVDPVSTVLIDQGIVHRNAAVAVGFIRKWIVDRALENDRPRSVRG